MRPILLLLAATLSVVGCNDAATTNDMAVAADMHAASDLTASASGDMTAVAPFNMPGSIFCYSGPVCSTTSASPVCCDSRTDGGFADTCVASAASCLAMDSQAKTFQCGQAADCGAGMICCGSVGTSSSGKPFLNSTSCAASCASGDKQLCVAASECKTSGASCVGQSITGRDIGLCQ